MAKLGFYIATVALIYLLASASSMAEAAERQRCSLDDDCQRVCDNGGFCSGRKNCVCRPSKVARPNSGPPCRYDADCKACGDDPRAYCDILIGACWCP